MCVVAPHPLTDLDLTDSAAVRAGSTARLPTHHPLRRAEPEHRLRGQPRAGPETQCDVTALLADLAAEIPSSSFPRTWSSTAAAGNYDESAPVNPLSVYAETKVAAEQVVLANPRHTVIRTSLNGGTSPTGDRGFNEQIRRAWQAGKPYSLFTDEFRSPIAAEVTARAFGNWRPGGARALSRRRKRTALALANRPTPGRALAAVGSPARTRLIEGLRGRAPPARHLAELRQSPEAPFVSFARPDGVARRPSGRSVLTATRPPRNCQGTKVGWRSADFQVCRIADFQVGRTSRTLNVRAVNASARAGSETCDTADLEVCATRLLPLYLHL